MSLLLGTSEGLYVAPDGDTWGADRAVAAPVNRICRFDGPGVLAATDEGVYRSVGGREWTHLGTVGHPVPAVAATREGRIYAGTRPARVYASDDGGQTWRELADLTTERADHSPREEQAVRALAADGERVLAGVDPGGVLVSEDGGETWTECSRGPTDGVNHLLGIALLAGPRDPGRVPGTYVASADDGLYRTDDAGERWQRLDGPGVAHLEAIVHDGRLFAAVRGCDATGLVHDATGPVVVEYDLDEDGGTVRRVGGDSGEFVGSFARHMGRLLAGTVREGPARVLVRNPDGTWSTLGETPAGVVSMVGI